MILLIPGVLLAGLAVYYLAELWHWLQDRRVAARVRESARRAAERGGYPEQMSGEEAAAYLGSLRERGDL